VTWELSLAKPLLLLHALAGFSTLAISVHLLVFALWGNRADEARIRRSAARTASILWTLFLAALITGALIYPAYRVMARPWLDGNAPFLHRLFEVKEHWASMGLFLAWACWWHFRRFSRNGEAPRDRAAWRAHTAMAALLFLVAAANVLIGLWIVMERSV
jgi:hypothetical protein